MIGRVQPGTRTITISEEPPVTATLVLRGSALSLRGQALELVQEVQRETHARGNEKAWLDQQAAEIEKAGDDPEKIAPIIARVYSTFIKNYPLGKVSFPGVAKRLPLFLKALLPQDSDLDAYMTNREIIDLADELISSPELTEKEKMHLTKRLEKFKNSNGEKAIADFLSGLLVKVTSQHPALSNQGKVVLSLLIETLSKLPGRPSVEKYLDTYTETIHRTRTILTVARTRVEEAQRATVEIVATVEEVDGVQTAAFRRLNQRLLDIHTEARDLSERVVPGRLDDLRTRIDAASQQLQSQMNNAKVLAKEEEGYDSLLEQTRAALEGL